MAHVCNLSPLHRPPKPSLDRGPVQRRVRRAFIAADKPPRLCNCSRRPRGDRWWGLGVSTLEAAEGEMLQVSDYLSGIGTIASG